MLSLRTIFARVGIALTVAAGGGVADAQSQQWIRQFGTTGTDYASAVASDAAGGAFVGGTTAGSLGGKNEGGGDIWLARYNAAGGQSWVRQIGSSIDDFVEAILRSSSSAVFVTGNTTGELATQNNGTYDGWLARYDESGNQAWLQQYGTSDYDVSKALAPDGSGGVFVLGTTQGNLHDININVGMDVWLARYSASGSQQWGIQFGAFGNVYASGISADGTGGVFIAGRTFSDLGQGPILGSSDAWVARYNSAGARIWLRQFGTSGSDDTLAAASDGSGGVYVVGAAYSGVQSTGDAWIARYDAAGNQVWIRFLASNAEDRALSVASDGAGGAYVSGRTAGALVGQNAGGQDAWAAHYDALGNRTWLHQFGTGSADEARSIASDGAGAAFIAGITAGSLVPPPAGAEDAWLARYGASCAADISGNNVVEVTDLLAVINGWGACAAPCPPHCAADVDDNCQVNVTDLLAVINAWGPC